MMTIEHFAYVMGRAVGAALHELLEGFWPATAMMVAEAMTPDIAPFDLDIPVTDADVDWFRWAEPASVGGVIAGRSRCRGWIGSVTPHTRSRR